MAASTFNNPANPSAAQALPTTFIFQVSGPRATVDPSLQVLALDAAITVVHSSEVDVTEFPVETGANITDNARPKPDTIMIDGFVSETPISSNVTSSATAKYPGRAKAAFDTLRQLKDSGTVMQVATAIHTYPNMVIERLSFPQDAISGTSLRFQASLRAIRVVSSQTINPPAAKTKAARTVANGTTPTTPAAPAVEASMLSKIQKSAENGTIKKKITGFFGGGH